MPDFMGFDWVMTNRLNIPAANKIDNMIFAQGGIGLHISTDLWSRITERADLSYAWQLYCAMSMDAVRKEDTHVVRGWLSNLVT